MTLDRRTGRFSVQPVCSARVHATHSEPLTVRRVVTEQLPASGSAIADDAAADRIAIAELPGYQWHRVWSGDGVRFSVVVIPPHSEGEAVQATSTLDLVYLASGEAWLEVERSDDVLMRAGDCVVQRRAAHAWHNRSAEPCVLVVCMVGDAP